MAAERIPTGEYLRTTEVLQPQELVYGYVREAAAPTAAHQRTVGAIFIRLAQHLRDTGTGGPRGPPRGQRRHPQLATLVCARALVPAFAVFTGLRRRAAGRLSCCCASASAIAYAPLLEPPISFAIRSMLNPRRFSLSNSSCSTMPGFAGRISPNSRSAGPS